MSNLIGFDKLFDSGSFDKGTQQLAKFLERITDEITKAEIAAEDLTKALGAKLRQEIQQLSSTSKNLNKDLLDMNTKMSQFQSTVSNTKKVISDYEKENVRLRNELEKLKTAQDTVGKSTKATSISMGQVTQSLLGVATGAALVHQGLQFLKNQLVQAVQATIEFEKVMKEVQAVSGATGEELALLTANANKLGSTTEKTAIQIAEAQKELAKLGFTTPEILLATKAIVDLSTATQEDLVKSAGVAAATVRSFGLDVDQLGRVTDVMTKSFVISALDLEKFRESMKLVAPIAASTNVEIEAVTAALAKLSDTGISGSLSGTALRNLLSSMADPTEKLVKFIGQYDETLKDGIKSSEDFTRALNVLKNSNIDLETAVSMVDVRARSAFFTLVEYADDVEYLALELQYLDGETAEVAKTMRDTLANDIQVAASAFDSLRRNAVEPLIPAMRTVTQEVTQIIEALRLSGNSFGEWFRTIKEGTEDELNIFEKMLAALIYDLEWLARPFTLGADKAFGAMVESNNIGKANEVFESLNLNVNKIIEDFGKLNTAVYANNKASEELAKTGSYSAETIDELRQLYPDLSAKVEDNKHFLILLRGETDKQISAASGHITALKAEEQSLTEFIDALKEEQKTKGLSTERTKQLTDAETYLKTLIDLRIGQEIHITKLKEDSAKANINLSETTDELIEKEKKLMELRGQLGSIQVKTAEDIAKYNYTEEKDLDKKIQLLEVYKNARVRTLNQQLSAELNNINTSKLSEEEISLKREIAYAKHRQQMADIDRDYFKELGNLRKQELQEEKLFAELQSKILTDYQKKLEERQKFEEGLAKNMTSLEEELLAADKKFAEQQFKNLEESDRKKAQAEEDARQRTIRVAEQTAQELAKIVKFSFDNNQLMREKELAEIDDWESEQTRLMGDNEDAKLRIQEQAESRRREVKRKQARDNRTEAMFQIAIDTAANVVRSILQNGGIPTGIPFGLAAAALGAAQLALVASRPLPAFAKGTDNSPEGFAEVGERGRELVKDGRTGKWSITPDKSTVTYLTKGSQVIPNAQTEMILKNDPNVLADNYLKPKVVQVNTPQIDYNKITNGFREAVSTIPINITNFDQNGVANFVVKKSVKLRRLNKRY